MRSKGEPIRSNPATNVNRTRARPVRISAASSSSSTPLAVDRRTRTRPTTAGGGNSLLKTGTRSVSHSKIDANLKNNPSRRRVAKIRRPTSVVEQQSPRHLRARPSAADSGTMPKKASSATSGRKKGLVEASVPKTDLLLVDNRNKARRLWQAISSEAFLEGEADEEEARVATSSSSWRRRRCAGALSSIDGANSVQLQYDNQPPANKKEELPSMTRTPTNLVKRQRNRSPSSSFSSSTNEQKGKQRPRSTTTSSSNYDRSPPPEPRLSRSSTFRSECKIGKKMLVAETTATLTRDAMPKRKASLDARSAMVAMTLQMQRPILKSTDFGRSSMNGKRSDSSADSPYSTSIKKMAKVPKKRLPEHAEKATTAKRRKSNSPSKSSVSPTKTLIQEQQIIPPYSQQPVQCTCQSPPVCPLHYQLQCACHHHQYHHHHHHHAGVAPTSGGGSAETASSAALISSIFPFPPPPLPSPSSMGSPAASAAVSISHYSQQQQQQPTPPGPWPASAWAFPTAAHVLATVATPNAAGASTPDGSSLNGFPAVFQGHVFIRPHLPSSIFVDTSRVGESCNLALHYSQQQQQQRHPSPPVSVLDASTESSRDFSCVDKINRNQSSEDDDDDSGIKMVAKNVSYELIQGANTSPLTMKLAKKGIDKKEQKKRKPSNGSSDRSSKRKKQKRVKKYYDLDQTSSIAGTSLWEPIGAPTRKWVYLNNDAKPVRRDCFEAIRHKREGEVIRVRDCVVIKSGDTVQQQLNDSSSSTKRTYVAKVAEFFVNQTGTLWASLAWYYWPEQAEVTTIEDRYVFERAHPKELLASRHIDCVSVDSIEDVAFVVTVNEYNRYSAENKAEWSYSPSTLAEELVPRAWSFYSRRRLMPADDTDDAVVYFCRRVYDFHGKRLLRNPSF